MPPISEDCRTSSSRTSVLIFCLRLTRNHGWKLRNSKPSGLITLLVPLMDLITIIFFAKHKL